MTTSEPSGQDDSPPSSTKNSHVRWREVVSVMVELAGLGALSAGFWLIRPWCGLVVLGVGLMMLGFAASPRFDRRKWSR